MVKSVGSLREVWVGLTDDVDCSMKFSGCCDVALCALSLIILALVGASIFG